MPMPDSGHSDMQRSERGDQISTSGTEWGVTQESGALESQEKDPKNYIQCCKPK